MHCSERQPTPVNGSEARVRADDRREKSMAETVFRACPVWTDPMAHCSDSGPSTGEGNPGKVGRHMPWHDDRSNRTGSALKP